jgi:hypothetical protein
MRLAHQVSRVIGVVCVVLIDTAVLFTQVSRHAAQRGHRNDVCLNITWYGLSALQSCTHCAPGLPGTTQRAASIQPVLATTHHAETLSLIGAVEANPVQLKQHVLLQSPASTSPSTSPSLPAQATIVLPPSCLRKSFLSQPRRLPTRICLNSATPVPATSPTAPVWCCLPA